jgi:predicted dehydrogenase
VAEGDNDMKAIRFAAGALLACLGSCLIYAIPAAQQSTPQPCARNDTLVEELEEFAAAARGHGQHEVGGEYATRSLAVVRAGILSAREGRRVEVAETLDVDRNL